MAASQSVKIDQTHRAMSRLLTRMDRQTGLAVRPQVRGVNFTTPHVSFLCSRLLGLFVWTALFQSSSFFLRPALNNRAEYIAC